MNTFANCESTTWFCAAALIFIVATGTVCLSPAAGQDKTATQPSKAPDITWGDEGEFFIAGAVYEHDDTTADATKLLFYTSKPSTAQVSYGLDDKYGKTATSATPAIRHEVAIAGLQPETTYHYKLTAKSSAGETAESPDFTFRTKRNKEQMAEHKKASDIKTKLTVVEVTKPGVLDKSDTYYLLTGDIKADDTAFVIGKVSNIVLDLNGYTVSFANTPKEVEALTYNGVQKGNIAHFGIAAVGDPREVPDTPEANRQWNQTARGVVIMNGTITQGTDAASYLSGICLGGMTDVQIAYVHVHLKGKDTAGIGSDNATGVTVHDCLLTSESRHVTNRHQQRRAIWVGSKGNIHDNTVRGFPQFGICGGKDGMVYNNDIADNQNAANAYAMSFDSGTKVLCNYVHPLDGRGCGGGGSGAEFRYNIVDVHEGKSPETDFTHALRVRYGLRETLFQNNFICSRGGYGNFGGAVSVRLSEDPGVKNKVINNVIASVTASKSFDAIALYVEGDDKATQDSGDILRGNKIVSNDVCVKMGGYNGPYCNMSYDDNTLVKDSGVKDFRTFEIGDYRGPCTGHVFTDTSFESGASFDTIKVLDRNTEIIVRWTLTVKTTPGAKVTVTDKAGKEVFSGTADDKGLAAMPLVQFVQAGQNRTVQTPHVVKAEKDGKTAVKSLAIDKKQEIELKP